MTKIVLVDDEVAILRMVELFLQTMGYEVQTAASGAAVRELAEPLPDLILLDVWLDGEDGRELCRWLKDQERTRRVPVFLLSAYVSQPESLRACGADEFVPKPFRLQELGELIACYLPSERAVPDEQRERASFSPNQVSGQT